MRHCGAVKSLGIQQPCENGIKKNWCGTGVKRRLEQAGLEPRILSVTFLSLWQNIQDNLLTRRKTSFWIVVSAHGLSAALGL